MGYSVDIKRRKAIDKLSGKESPLSVRDLVIDLEQCVVNTLADYGIEGYPKSDAPGVYINGKKSVLSAYVSAKVAHSTTSLNIHMDLSPLDNI